LSFLIGAVAEKKKRLTLEGHPALADFQRQFERDPMVAETHPGCASV